MQTILPRIKHVAMMLMLSACFCDGIASPVSGSRALEEYRALYKDSVTPVKYLLVDENGKECCSGGKVRKVFVLDITQTGRPNYIHSASITRLANAHFNVEVDPESVIETLAKDFLVLKMSRPRESSKRAVSCAAGMGEDRAYLVSVGPKRMNILESEFLGCGDTFRVLKSTDAKGYEVTVNHFGSAKSYLSRYILKNGKMMKTKAPGASSS